MFHLLRYLFLVLLCTAAHILSGCTAFTVTQGGRTLIGNNEDAWSINPQVRYEQGRDGHYGAIYFGHYNGSPLRTMTDQLGMNEAGLVFDGLSIPLVHAPAKAGLRSAPLDALLKQVMHTCADVGEAAALLRTYDMSMIPHAMLFLADKHGGWLIVQNDTIMQGHDPWYAVGNWRMSTCTDPSTILIPRLQQGRQLLSAGSGTSLEEARDVLARMAVCRKKMGEGTLFSTLFDPAEGQVHLYFYHDFSEGITFNLKDELAKGDRTVAMASLFGPRPEFERLANYITPFHQRWLFWGMLGWMVLAGIMGTWSAVTFVRLLFKRTARPSDGASIDGGRVLRVGDRSTRRTADAGRRVLLRTGRGGSVAGLAADHTGGAEDRGGSHPPHSTNTSLGTLDRWCGDRGAVDDHAGVLGAVVAVSAHRILGPISAANTFRSCPLMGSFSLRYFGNALVKRKRLIAPMLTDNTLNNTSPSGGMPLAMARIPLINAVAPSRLPQPTHWNTWPCHV